MEQKSVATFGESQSDSSLPVEWNTVDGEEEVFDSVVNYRLLAPIKEESVASSGRSNQSYCDKEKSKRNFKKKQRSSLVNKDEDIAKANEEIHESDKDVGTNIRRRHILGQWQRLLDRLQVVPSSSPYISCESIENQQKEETCKSNLATTDVALETCFFPPHQRAVVREVAPMLAYRMCTLEDTDSCGSETLEKRIPLLKSSKSRKDTNTTSRSGASLINKTQYKGRSKKTAAGGSNGTIPTLRQRQQELHNIRMRIEKRRLELLDLKLVRERADALRHEILFHKDLQLKHHQIRSYEDFNSSQA